MTTYRPYIEAGAGCQWMYLSSKTGWRQCADEVVPGGDFCSDHLGPALKSNVEHDDAEVQRDMAVFGD